jgi:hypothetical protein
MNDDEMTFDEYAQVYYDRLAYHRGRARAAYEDAERQHEGYFGKKKYKNLQSFRTVLSRNANKKY